MQEHESRRSGPRRYTDLTLEMRDLDDGSYTVTASGSDVGETGEVESRLDRQDLAASLTMLERGLIPENELLDLGRSLSARLLPEGEIRDAVMAAVRVAGPDSGVRLRLLIREPALAALPWELTHLTTGGRDSPADFLVLNPRISIVRHEPLPVPGNDLKPKDPERLRMLAVTANAHGFPPLALEVEQRTLTEALVDLPGDGMRVDLQPVLENPTLADLQAAAVLGADLFHFAGHGGFGNDGGFIALPAPNGRADLVPAAKVAKILRQAGVRIAVVGACQSGARSTATRWEGVAAALVAEQVTAVVAMQYPIRDSHATAFSRGFYSALAAGLSLDEAVAAGRLAVYGLGRPGFSWGIPTLYSRSADGVVFPSISKQSSASAESLRTVIRQVVDGIEEGGRAVGIKVARASAGVLEVHQQASQVRGEVVGIESLEMGTPRPADGG